MKIDENSYYRQRNSSYLLNDLRNFNKIFRKDTTYDNVKGHKKTEFYSLFRIIRRYIFRKVTGKGQIDPLYPPPKPV